MIKGHIVVGYPDTVNEKLNKFYEQLSEIKNSEVLDVHFSPRGNYEVGVMVTYEDGTGGPLKYRRPIQKPMEYIDPDNLGVPRGD